MLNASSHISSCLPNNLLIVKVQWFCENICMLLFFLFIIVMYNFKMPKLNVLILLEFLNKLNTWQWLRIKLHLNAKYIFKNAISNNKLLKH